MSDLPSGTLRFLFTDIEGSTVRWERSPEAMRNAVARHDVLLRTCMEEHGGAIFKTVGDAFYVVFTSVGDALSAAIAAQHLLEAEIWPEEVHPLRVRMGLHTGEAEHRGNDYFGQPLNRVARILSAGHGSQILLSRATRGLVNSTLPCGMTLRDLGGHRLKDIQNPEQIFQVIAAGLPSEFPPLKTLDRHPNNLPTQLTPFVGRKQELDDIAALLAQRDVRLVTLIGPGGTGKTRLCLQAAADSVDFFLDGVYYVELSDVREVDSVIVTIIRTLEISEAENTSPLSGLKEYLSKKKVLLLLDNFEQVTDAAPLVLDMLKACSGLKVLVTSRAALYLEGEHEYHVPPLGVPELKKLPFDLNDLAEYEAIALFMQQARSVKRDFRLTEANAPVIIEICSRLDGLPLAIELAAARVGLLPPQAMLKRLDSRLQLLKGGKRDRSARQQTLRGAIAWSYDLLNTDEKALFIQLGVFTGGCTLEAIEAVCSAVEELEDDLLDVLKSLIDKSLLRQQEQENGEPHFTMLYTIREFALEQLVDTGNAEALQRRHFEYYLELAEEAAPTLTGEKQRFWLARLEHEQADLLSAFRWCLEQNEIEGGLRLAGALWRFWLMRGHLYEGRFWLEKLLGVSPTRTVAPLTRARALEGASALACRQKDYAQATVQTEEALMLGQQLDDQKIMKGIYISLAEIAYMRGDSQRAATLFEESLKICRALGDKRGIAALLNNLGNVSLQQGNIHQAAMLFDESLALLREVGDKLAIASVLNNLGETERLRNNFEKAACFYEESLKLGREMKYTWGIAASLANLGNITRYQGDLQHALSFYQESLTLFHEMGDQLGVAFDLEGVAEISYAQNKPEQATRLFAQYEYTLLYIQ